MSKIIERCAGIDIGKRFLLCCALTGAAHDEPRSETRRVNTSVPELEDLRAWLKEKEITHVVMESTGSYWIPVFNLLEGYFTVVLVNPEEVKNRLEEEVEELDTEILRRMQIQPFQNAFTLLQTMPGVGRLSAATIVAETVTDMAAFATAEQMASWAGLCPRNRESAGIQKGRQTTHGNPYLRMTLVQCAWAAARKQDSLFRARFQQLAPRRGEKRAIMAVAHSMLIVLYCVLIRGVPYRGAEDAPKQRRRQRRAHHHLKCLRRLGLTVQITARTEPDGAVGE
ncbi:MAG TPA: transposase [Bryobacteraceae bacterium]|jgi:transposase|nr:transposase [Bryobacteraceae bacterium]